MPRSLRIEFPGAHYHVLARGNHRQDISLSNSDRETFLHTLEQTSSTPVVRVLASVLMGSKS